MVNKTRRGRNRTVRTFAHILDSRQLGFGTRRLLGKSPVDEGRRLTALKKFEKTKPYVNV